VGRSTRTALAALGCLAALLAGCTVGPSQRPPIPVRDQLTAPAAPDTTVPPAMPGLRNLATSLVFRDCTADTIATLDAAVPPDRTLSVGCSSIIVPSDPDRPLQGGVRLGVVRVDLAGGPANRPPLLVLGDSAGAASADRAVQLATRVDPELLTTFTLIGLDRRGTGQNRLDCATPETRATLVDADPAASSEPILAALLENARAVVQACAVGNDLLGYRSAVAVSDVEQLRGELGVSRLSAIGSGDGATVLERWARTTPGSVGRLVLDGPVDPTRDEPMLAESRADAAEAAFDAFAVACTSGPDCPLGPDPRATVGRLLDELRLQPLATGDGRRLTSGAVVTALLTALGEPAGWPALSAALAAAGAGDPAALLPVLEPVLGPQGRLDAMLATACNDTRRRLTPREVGRLAASWQLTHPLFGSPLALRSLACAAWPVAERPQRPAGGSADLPPILVIGTATDPRSPQDGARRIAEELPTARLLVWAGTGSGAYPRTPCVRDTVDLMLVAGTPPPNGTLCPP
jgi:pimeloyl-ACP methyl ester carboxylesterase